MTSLKIVNLQLLWELYNINWMKFFILYPTILIFLISCATSYQSEGWTGGFSETQIDENIYIVKFNGNGYTSSSRADDFTLLRSAELTLEKGFNYFQIIDSDSYVEKKSGSIPITTYNSGTLNYSGSYGSGYGSYGGYETKYQNITISKPSSKNTVLMLKEKPNGMSYKAELIYNSLKKQYNLE